MNWLNNFVKWSQSLTMNWVDFATLIVLMIGVVRGRKRGMSEELLDTTQWVIIIIAGGLFYHALGDLFTRPVVSRLACYMISYVGIALVVKVMFVLIKKKLGQKLLEGDVFGRYEYYGGMLAGAVRFGCIYFFALSLLNAPHYSAEFLAQRAKEVDYNYGSDFFPHPSKMQVTVFEKSMTGQNAKKYLSALMIERTSSNAKGLRDNKSLAKHNERTIDAIMSGK